jgi:hypothetical protein
MAEWKFFGAISHIGNNEGDLDAIKSQQAMEDGDCALVIDTTNGTFDVYRADANSSAAPEHTNFTVIQPADESATPGFRWLKLDIKGVDGSFTEALSAASIKLAAGATIVEFSTDGTFAGNSDTVSPTEKASKTYSDAVASAAAAALSAHEADTSTHGVSEVADAADAGMPVGTVMMYAKEAVPTGYLACDGAAVSRTTYSALFAVIAEIWGIGDGSTTFNVPDLEHEFIRAADNSSSVVATEYSATSLAQGRGGGFLGFKNSDGSDGTRSGYYFANVGAVTETYYKFRPDHHALKFCIKY